MKYLFIHQNIPGQWRHIAAELAKNPENFVTIMGVNKDKHIAGVNYVFHTPIMPSIENKMQLSNNKLLQSFESAVIFGQSAALKLWQMKQAGYVPDVILCHPGWGEGLFIKDIYPDVPYVAYTEFYYHSSGADVGFVPGSSTIETSLVVRSKNARLILALEQADYCITPTKWQFSMQPQFIKDKTAVIHEGIRTSVCTPKDKVQLTLPNGHIVRKGDEVITYVARNLEPYRGFPSFMQALPEILAARPSAQVLIVGGHGVSYGAQPDEGGSWKDKMLREVPLDLERVHFLGVQPYEHFLAILRISSAHIYLTYPFVLSWSLLEAMACEALIIGSNTAPLQEVIEDGKNGMLVDFFDSGKIAHAAIEALGHPDKFKQIRKNARQTIIDRYDMDVICLPQMIQFVDDVVHKRAPQAITQANKIVSKIEHKTMSINTSVNHG